MHATAIQPNRRQRREAKFGKRVKAVVRKRPLTDADRPVESFWEGQCRCRACLKRKKRWPAVYIVYERIGERTHDNPRRDVSFECLVEWRELRLPLNGEENRSASVVSHEWIEEQHYAGVDVELHERAMLADDDPTAEVDRLASLREYLSPLPEHERRQREARYFELLRLWGERRYRRRLWQWLAVEFPGWFPAS